jgi:peptide/nickel transport system substrate-binding protein
MFRSRGLAVWLALLIMTGCAAPASPPSRSGAEGAAPAAPTTAPKKIAAAIMGDPPTPHRMLAGGVTGLIPGQDGLEQLTLSGLTVRDGDGVLRPMLGEAVPTTENGLWKLLPDGRMETTWKIRSDAIWHDGTPVTANDLVFTVNLRQDRDLPWSAWPGIDLVERIDAPDAQTAVVTWKQAFIWADDLFSYPVLPRHLVEKAYTDDRASFTAIPYWDQEFIGNGPYRVKEWARDSHVVLQAFDRYPLGRPRIDEILLKFIPDENAFMANVLSNTVDITVGKSITLEQTLQIRDKWREGRIAINLETAMKLWPQLLNANPPVVSDLTFRKGVIQAIDRQALVDSLTGGLSQIAHTILLPGEAEFAEVQAAAVRYDYDPRRASDLIQSLGYTKGPDGMFRDTSGQPLVVEINATNEDQNTKPMFAVANDLKSAGVGVETLIIPVQRQRDREYRATFPAFSLSGGPSGVPALIGLSSSQARLPSSNYIGNNYSRYMNPEFDALIDRFHATIPHRERMDALRAIVAHMSDNLPIILLHYAASTSMINNRLDNIGKGRNPTWNAQEWDVK